jgi:hypothetical protein
MVKCLVSNPAFKYERGYRGQNVLYTYTKDINTVYSYAEERLCDVIHENEF